VITDDQIARLVRDAGHAAPSSLQVDLRAVEQRVAHDRSVARTTGLLASVAALIVVATVWFDPQSKLLDHAAASGSRPTAFSWAPLMVVVGLLLATIVATAIAARRAAQTAPGSRLRASVAASWGVLGMLALGPTGYITSTWIAYPDYLVGLRALPLVTAVAGGCFVLSWLAMAARRRALALGRGAFLTSLWIVSTWGIGAWTAVAMLPYLGHGPRLEPIEPHSGLTLATAVAVALASGAVLRRRAGVRHPFLRGAALTIAVAAVVPAYGIGSATVLGTATWLTERTTGFALAIGSLAVALVAARLSLAPSVPSAWLAAALGIATVSLAAPAAVDLASALLRAAGAPGGSIASGVAWTVGLAIAAGLCLAALDRRRAWIAPSRTVADGERTTL
jgi:hypothetical protein